MQSGHASWRLRHKSGYQEQDNWESVKGIGGNNMGALLSFKWLLMYFKDIKTKQYNNNKNILTHLWEVPQEKKT